MSAPDDIGFWSKAAAGAATLATTLAAVVWGDLKRRVAKVETKIDAKADQIEVDRQRVHIEKIYDELGKHGVLLTKIDTTLQLMRRDDQ